MSRFSLLSSTKSAIARLRPLFLALVLAAVLTGTLFAGLQAGTQGLRVPENPLPFPAPNSHNVPLTTSIGVTYNEAIDPATVNTQTFAVHALQTGQLLEAYGVHSGTIVLTPTAGLYPGELVFASATTGTLSAIDGTGPLTPTVWQFRTAVSFGSGNFVDSGQALGTDLLGWGVEMGDLDGDGDLDVFVANRAGRPNKVWLNDGNGIFTDSGQLLGNDNTTGMAMGDIDGDGDLDVVDAGSAQSVVWINDGTGVFTSTQSLPAANRPALGDLDGDGDLDIFLARTGANQVWFNNGGRQGGIPGTFSDSGQNMGTSVTWEVALGDLDLDGDLDAFFVNHNFFNQVWLNEGAGFFTDTGQALGSSFGRGVALGDLNNDGLLDAFVGNMNNQSNEIWFNQGNAIFSLAPQSFPLGQTFDITLGDVDADGDLDAFWADNYGSLWLNDGGGFTIAAQLFDGSFEIYSIALADVNGDGDLDAFFGKEPSPFYVWLNNRPPTASGTVSPAVSFEGQAVTLTGILTDTDTQDAFTAAVNWGDATTETVPLPPGTTSFTLSHIYADDNPSGIIAVTVTDGDGSSAHFNVPITVQNVAPMLENVTLSPEVVDEGESVTLSGSIVEPGLLDPLTLVVIWGDNTQNNYNFPAGTTTFSATHTYLDDNPSGTPADIYDLLLIIVDDDDGSNVYNLSVTVNNADPVVFAGPDQAVETGSPISFTGIFTDPGVLDTFTITWDFGDGNSSSNTLTPTHTYEHPGLYTVTLTVNDDDGGSGSDTLLVTVTQSETGYQLFLPVMLGQGTAASSASIPSGGAAGRPGKPQTV